MSAYNKSQYKRVSACETYQDREIFKAHVNKLEGLEHLVERYHEIGREIEKEMRSKYPCPKTISMKFTKRDELVGILARQGINVQDQMDKRIIAQYMATQASIQSTVQPTKQK